MTLPKTPRSRPQLRAKAFPRDADLTEFNPWQFLFGEHPVRIVWRETDPWFVATDVCDVLEIANGPQATNRLECGEARQLVVDGPRGRREVWALNEPALYELIFTSRKPRAESFRKWVFAEVIPQIRRSGAYSPDAEPAADQLTGSEQSTFARGEPGAQPVETQADGSIPIHMELPGVGLYVVTVLHGKEPHVREVADPALVGGLEANHLRAQGGLLTSALYTIEATWKHIRLIQSYGGSLDEPAIKSIERTIIGGGQLARQVQVELDHVLTPKTRH